MYVCMYVCMYDMEDIGLQSVIIPTQITDKQLM